MPEDGTDRALALVALCECWPYGLSRDELADLIDAPHHQRINGVMRTLVSRNLAEREDDRMGYGGIWYFAAKGPANAYNMLIGDAS